LAAAEAMDEPAQANGVQAEGADDGMQKGIPDEPEPGIPEGPSGVGAVGEAGAPGVEGSAEEPAKGVPEEPEPGQPEEPEPAPAGTEDRPSPPPMTVGSGEPDAPKPGVPDEPTAAPPGTPGGAHHEGKEAGDDAEGPHALVRGRVDAPGGSGKIRIDLFDGDQRNVSGPRPKVVGVHEIDSPGGFELSVPLTHKRVWLGAYRDLNGNHRPDKGEPSGWYSRNPVFLDSLPASVVISLEVEGKSSGLGLDFGE
jgi:hypothetical protein